MSQVFYAGVWLGIQNFETAIKNVTRISDIYVNADTLEECRSDIKEALQDFDPSVTGRRFAIVMLKGAKPFSQATNRFIP